jgi:LPS sulfotransferase NodH
MQPHRSYLICATPRSGSFLLCEALSNTGVAGRPTEYFWRDDEAGWVATWGLERYTYGDYLHAVLEHGTTPNGIFGAKIMWGYLDDFVARVQRMPQYAVLERSQFLSAVFPDLHYVWLTRRDKVRQAVSHWKAIQTGLWGITEGEVQPPAREPVYDVDAIDHLVRELQDDDAAWTDYFAQNDIQPFTVIYEEFVERYEGTILDVLRFLDVLPPADLGVSKRRMLKQADAVSDEWARRYHAATR